MKLIFLFSFLCLSSIAIGVFVKEKMKNISFSNLHAMPLGFFIILGSYQVIAWPFMLFHLSTTLLAIITMMWLFVLMVMIISGHCTQFVIRHGKSKIKSNEGTKEKLEKEEPVYEKVEVADYE